MSETGLLAGPRGRRLCLEVAKELGGESVTLPLFWLARQHASEPGTMLAFVGDSSPEAVAEHREAMRAQTDAAQVSDLTAALVAVDPAAITGAVVAQAFARSVDMAMYWQPPDGDDTVAAMPEVIEALRPLAVAVQAHPSTAWWGAGVRAPQWAVQWDDVASTARLEIGTREDLDRWRDQVVAGEARAASDRPKDPGASYSGNWWSKPAFITAATAGDDSEGVPACISMVEDSLGWKEATAVEMTGTGRMCEIRGIDDWAELCRRYPLELTNEHRHDWYHVTGRDGVWVEPDWRAVAEDYDAVHLTAWAYLTGATREIVVDAERSSIIAGWGPDVTYWLTGTVRETGERVGWRRDPHGLTWMRAD